MRRLVAIVELDDGTRWEYERREGVVGPTVKIEPEGVYVNDPGSDSSREGRETFVPMHRIARVIAETRR